MISLFLKSSTLPMQFAIATVDGDNVELIDEIKDEGLLNEQASKTLLYAIDELLSRNDFSYHDINRIYVASGPGSYTSARLLVGIVKTIAFVNKDIQVFDASILDVFLEKTPVRESAVSIINARRKKYYVKGYLDNLDIEPMLIDDSQLSEITEKVLWINGVEMNNTQEKIDAIFKLKLDYSAWIKASHLVKDILLYEPYYLEPVNIG